MYVIWLLHTSMGNILHTSIGFMDNHIKETTLSHIYYLMIVRCDFPWWSEAIEYVFYFHMTCTDCMNDL